MTGGATLGNTPLDPDEAMGLIPSHIATMDELNEWEQANIVQAERWAFERKRKALLSVTFLLDLHRRMFGETWDWAGQTRTSEKTVGIRWYQIPEALANLCDDAKYWLENEVFGVDEAAARFHHRLTFIHPFPNGNGRHARLATDILLVSLGRPRFSWGLGDLRRVGDTRERYITALRAADDQDFKPLFGFLGLEERESVSL
jgi:Fic-DOC domain mobile mystery protein B